jgi:hypothetical protein
VKKGERKGGKKAKDRITLLLCCSATGEKLDPLIIGKSAKPRCLRGVNLKLLKIRYESNRKAWMTRDIFHSWLKAMNNKFQRQNRKILLFVDNCSAHPDVQLSNIKVKFLPPNTTSKLQPCDAGIIQTLKTNYRAQLVNHILFHIDNCSSASELAKSVNLLDAMKWILKAWTCLTATTIQKCFRNCGFSTSADCNEGDEELIALNPGSNDILQDMTLEEFANMDEHLETVPDEVCTASDSTQPDQSSDGSDDDGNQLEIKLPSHVKAYNYAKELYQYAIHHESSELIDLVDKVQSQIQNIQTSTKQKQSTLRDYFVSKSK